MVPDERHAELALREARVLMAPVVRWLLRHGVHYGPFAEMLKGSFVSVAREELTRHRAKTTDSAISVMSGVHRKDVRSLGQTPELLPLPRCVPLASQVLARWRAGERYCTAEGDPKPLPRSGAVSSFETLAREVSSDVHPRTLLDELLRLALVTLNDDVVTVAKRTYLPTPAVEEGTAEFSTSAADHIAAAVHNLTVGGPKYLEQSLTIEGLSAQSADALHGVARKLWQAAFETMRSEARERAPDPAPAGGSARMRFGVYYYSEAESIALAARP